MRVYIAGPMRGYADLNFPAFFEAEAALTTLGWDVINPARLNPLDAPLRQVIHTDLEALQTCDALFLLPGWGDSRGAVAEAGVAFWMGIPDFVTLDEAENWRSQNGQGCEVL